MEEDNTREIKYNPILKVHKKKETKKEDIKKEKKNRIITGTAVWTLLDDTDFTVEKQLEMLKAVDVEENRYLKNEIAKKLSGYKQQDLAKNKFNREEFIGFNEVVRKLLKSNLLCFYCTQPILVWYKQSRENMQWTLERIDNKIGHTNDNVEISCLLCNIRRRCMYSEKFRFTKQLKVCRVEEDKKSYKEEDA
uniref:Uncharacterized protein n=1 Tax=viral metagenome TaxID=1070528 RepID=A0A6C0HI22_9ZZZZ